MVVGMFGRYYALISAAISYNNTHLQKKKGKEQDPKIVSVCRAIELFLLGTKLL